MTNRVTIFWIAIFSTAILTACNGTRRPDGLPDLQPCRVTVTMNGTPLEGAGITLASDSGQWPGNGRTDASGVAKIRTRGQFDGVAVGDYKVTVAKVLPPPPSTKDEGSNEEAKPLVNTKFGSPATTPLTCTVKAGPNDFEFKVEAP